MLAFLRQYELPLSTPDFNNTDILANHCFTSRPVELVVAHSIVSGWDLIQQTGVHVSYTASQSWYEDTSWNKGCHNLSSHAYLLLNNWKKR